MSGLVEFLRARYTEAREAEARRVSLPDSLPFQWTAVYERDNAHVVIDGFHRVGMDEFFEQYGESAANPDVLADLDAKLAILDEHSTTRDVIAEKPDGLHGFGCATCHQDEGLIVGYGWCRTQRLLALPFAAHLDYDERWRP